MKVLITGGAGYIGSTIGTACEERGITPVILDDLSTGLAEFAAGRHLYVGDIADRGLLDQVMSEHPEIRAVIHCAAKTVVPESVQHPLAYYQNNVSRGIDLLRHLRRHGVERFLFSSSAAVYAANEDFTVDESSPIAPQSPYARSKAMFEDVLRDAAVAHGPRVISLRYFNPIGADPGLRTGLQNPAPTHVLGKLITAWRTGEGFVITGADWPTRDGTAIRDYIHVWDLAHAHVAAVEKFDGVTTPEHPYQVINVGTGTGVTVKELLTTFQTVIAADLQVAEGPRRPGDTVGVYTRSVRAAQWLNWRAERDVADGIRDSLAWAERFATRT